MKSIKSSNYVLLTKVYASYVRPLLESNSQLFNVPTQKYKDCLESVQKCITRFIYKRCRITPDIPPYPERLTFLNLQPLSDRRNKFDLKFVSKIISGKIFVTDRLIPKFVSSRTRGSQSKIQIPRCKTTVRQNFFINRAFKLYSLHMSRNITAHNSLRPQL